MASFQRQLGLYGFSRISSGMCYFFVVERRVTCSGTIIFSQSSSSSGPDKGSYYHELFLRGMTFLAVTMKRTKIKGELVRRTTDSSKTEPNFFSMNFLPGNKAAPKPATMLQGNMNPFSARLLRDEYMPVNSSSSSAMLPSKIMASLPSTMSSHAAVAAMANHQAMLERALIMKASWLGLIPSAAHPSPEFLPPALPNMVPSTPYDLYFQNGRTSSNNTLFPMSAPTRGPLVQFPSSGLLDPNPPAVQVDPAISAALREIYGHRRDW